MDDSRTLIMHDALALLEQAAKVPLGPPPSSEATPLHSGPSNSGKPATTPTPVAHDAEPKRKSQATRLVDLAMQRVEVFHTPDREPFADVLCGDHREIWPVKSKSFRHWLAGQYFQATKGAAGAQAVQDALAVLSAIAIFHGEEKAVHVRLADYNGCIYLDLSNSLWQVVRISVDGWDVTNTTPIPFRRSKSMLPIPPPIAGGSVDLLRKVLNITDDTQWTLLIGYLLAALRPHGPFPLLVLSGEQGTGKSWIAEVVKTLLDPATAGNRGEPRDTRDLMIAAINGWVLSFDNLSRISPELSDAFCRLSTGGGLATRELYSDAEEMIFDAERPIVLNSITDIVNRADLLDRTVLVCADLISEDRRQEKRQLVAQFETIRPLVLGALLDAVVHGLRTINSVRLPRLPRMADFAVWVTACTPALEWDSSRFLNAYSANRSEAVELSLDASPIVDPLRTFIGKQGKVWGGSASLLLKQLTELAGESVSRRKGWPSTANHLSSILKRLAPGLRATGLVVTINKGVHGRTIQLEQAGNSSSSSSSSSLNTPETAQQDDQDDEDDELQTFSYDLPGPESSGDRFEGSEEVFNDDH